MSIQQHCFSIFVTVTLQKDLTIPCDGPQPDKTGNNILECDIGNPLSAGKKVISMLFCYKTYL